MASPKSALPLLAALALVPGLNQTAFAGTASGVGGPAERLVMAQNQGKDRAADDRKDDEDDAAASEDDDFDDMDMGVDEDDDDDASQKGDDVRPDGDRKN
ncbi:hypothetical protein [Hansschlegelia zhihuaiae]|uniref:Uncharacterized protein n=1 Tax=Hansschlegelia zhihuaiae TaxID=405005 RepID=A0A4Q0MJG8_9HYPH|nr:hypothetical protein [Hansschlegelia zhihuaiae]RXF73533.1 hypothetical protein EK403_10090 [Hansschlegelia zhihuaiae]